MGVVGIVEAMLIALGLCLSTLCTPRLKSGLSLSSINGYVFWLSSIWCSKLLNSFRNRGNISYLIYKHSSMAETVILNRVTSRTLKNDNHPLYSLEMSPYISGRWQSAFFDSITPPPCVIINFYFFFFLFLKARRGEKESMRCQHRADTQDQI